jgi:hypothetical protein
MPLDMDVVLRIPYCGRRDHMFLHRTCFELADVICPCKALIWYWPSVVPSDQGLFFGIATMYLGWFQKRRSEYD